MKSDYAVVGVKVEPWTHDAQIHHLRVWKTTQGDEVQLIPELTGLDVGNGLVIKYNDPENERLVLWTPGQTVWHGVGLQMYVPPEYYLCAGYVPHNINDNVWIVPRFECLATVNYGKKGGGIRKSKKIVFDWMNHGKLPI